MTATAEAGFLSAIDADPGDFNAILAYADWLQDHDSPLAAGYRALGLLRKRPWWFKGSGNYGWWSDGSWDLNVVPPDRTLPADWLRAIPTSKHVLLLPPSAPSNGFCVALPVTKNTYRVAKLVAVHVLLKATAAGFGRLSEQRQAEILEGRS